VILPALEIEGRIIEYTAQRWLKFKLRYKCKEARKGVYIDRHERSDVIEERKEFLKQLASFEPYVTHVQAMHALA